MYEKVINILAIILIFDLLKNEVVQKSLQ